jgi:hypothetical protein
MRNESHPTVVARRRFFDTDASRLAEAAADCSIGTWSKPPRQLPGQLAFYENPDVLVVVCPPPPVASEEALAWGLVYASDRDLILVLPDVTALPTLQRLPWIDVPVRVFTYNPLDPATTIFEAPIPARVEILGEIRTWGQRGRSKPPSAVLGEDRGPWIANLVDWLDGQPLIDARHRDSYLAWHTAGQQILKISRTRHGLELLAGVRYSVPADGQVVPVPPLNIDGPVDEAEFTVLTTTIEAAVSRRVEATDNGNEEHRLQHHLLNLFERDRSLVGLHHLIREFPAWRPGRSPAYIDFLGADDRGVPHIVEVKLDNEVMLVLQALDYWIWASANPDLIGAQFGIRPSATPAIDFVVGAFKTSKVIGPYMLRQLEALAGEIPWRFHVVKDWRGSLRISTLPPRTVPAPPDGWAQVGQPRYQRRLHDHLIAENRALRAGGGPFYRRPTAGLLDATLAVHADLEQRNRVHAMAGHVRSSQAFALNLFAGRTTKEYLEICIMAGLPDVTTINDIVFEYEDLTDVLGEATAASPHRTQVDVAIFCSHSDGRRAALLIEVKLSEIDFGHCSAYQAAANDRRDVCISAGPFGRDPQACFQLRNHDREQRQTYETYLGPTPTSGCGCTFRLLNQPMRNVALARTLIESRSVAHVVHALCAPRANRTIWRRWTQAKAALAGTEGVALADLPADELIHILNDDSAATLTERYQLG